MISGEKSSGNCQGEREGWTEREELGKLPRREREGWIMSGIRGESLLDHEWYQERELAGS